jgi:prepilin-type N-terminal cleavage/methylation domain-containing protein
MKFFTKKGFTLIEMLIVIAIIGILSAAVLAGLGPARNKAKDARLISAMNQLRSIAEALYNPSSATPYANLKNADGSFQADLAKVDGDITSASAGSRSLTLDIGTGSYYTAYVSLLATNDIYCVDSTGFSGVPKTGKAPQVGEDCSGTAYVIGGGGINP